MNPLPARPASEPPGPDIGALFLDVVDRVQELRANAAERPALQWQPQLLERTLGPQPLPEVGEPLEAVVGEAFARIEQGYCNVAHPLYLGYISPKPLLQSTLGDFIASSLNQTPGAWRAGPAATQIEWETLAWLRDFIGLPAAAPGEVPGIVTTGGSMANLSALKLARDRACQGAVSQGLRSGDSDLTVYMSREGHFSVLKAADMLGLGRDQVRLVETDAAGRVLPERLAELMRADRARGCRPLCIVGVAGTSANGAVDPLPELARLAEEHGCWFHVDGAAGAALGVLPELRGLFAGLERADSVALDPCKWLFTAFGLGCLFVREPAQLRRSFDVLGHYWEDLEEPEFFRLSFNGTRQWRSLGLWMSLRALGVAGYRDLLRGITACADRLAAKLHEHGGFELLPRSALPVVCFRPGGPDAARAERTRRLQRCIARDGQAYLTLLDWRGEPYLRAAFNNYSTLPGDVDRLVQVLDQALSGA
ncbi:pyridoxal-dependent decarboxylase [Aquabacterium sp. A7-Y]|uniref:pyridoxal phosphate-dependent decarboxylase family protein n=1 Tax=Aquabacterium sp. A7-Y TaxID=1349605 RepID=UPI00223CB682|nr:pyridoxal-dependent decarboxylase [Aquabacterium sp. A7-Y]MCW7536901.1 pyridoxal-dependent decarboxylase [Aquabacterium sp. A7-Y]